MSERATRLPRDAHADARRMLTRLLLAGATLALAGTALAQQLPVRDPTRPAGGSGTAGGNLASTAERFELAATIVSGERRIALINGRFFREGERVNGQQITRIEPGAIRLMRAGNEVLIRVHARPADGNDGEQGQ